MLHQIAQIQIKEVSQQLKHQGISIEISEAALSRVTELGFHANFGARPLKRVIQREILDPISNLILEGKLLPQTTLGIDFSEGAFIFT